ncbi:ADP-ribosylglycohydrolase family protein [Geminicoccaceae bacterium 1502E]|nr:ADP-ribosylglycohydrolase family protein [Geminicoccaceae bacterium 1502E]
MSGQIDRRERMLGAVLGQFVGDALCLGSHWYYDMAERDRILPGGPEGFDRPVDGHYHAGRGPGDLTHYGEAALILLRSLAAQDGLDVVDQGRRLVAHFGAPEHVGYLDKATRELLARWRAWQDRAGAGPYGFQDGADDHHNVTTSRLAPLAVRHAGDPRLPELVAAVVRICQNNAQAIAYARVHAAILMGLFDGSTLRKAVEESLAAAPEEELRVLWPRVEAMLATPVLAATGEFGRACALASAFPAALHAALRHEDDPAEALLACCRAGGDNASRCALVGAWLGARHGLSGLPAEWVARLNEGEEIRRLAGRILPQAA